jgi:hypothetical protein
MLNLHAVLAVIIVLLLLYILYKARFQYGYYNTTLTAACHNCEKYNVHNAHSNKDEAAKLLKEITNRNNILIDHLKTKYVDQPFLPGLDPNKNNKIDVVANSSLKSEYVQERINQLVKHYNEDQIYEISPLNKDGFTSYTEDKKKLIFCLRKKEKNNKGEHDLHDINTIMFVVVHELSHMMNSTWGHGIDFWILFKFMLENAVDAGIYKPIDYRKNPIVYCGMKISYSPLYDTALPEF